jgi:hypothetical protein
VSAADNVGAEAMCSPASGATLAAGVHAIGCTATDAAGNQAQGTFNVTVLGAAEQIANLIELVKGVSIPATYRTQLIGTLQTVLANPRSTRLACPALSFFISAVRAKSGTLIPVDRATQMIDDATRIRAVLGC